ncbi:MAG: hypothetical protein NC453_26860 [Muribaculum sp.]|nr:hypothetical protein [Muribaculum sp.]
MKKIYLDIDGVLLTTKNTRAAEGVLSFLKFVTAHFDCYWLTTHCKGDAQPAINYVSRYIPNSKCMLSKIKPTNWNTLKTEAIDLKSEFYWLDDYPMMAERFILQKNDVESRLIVVDLNRHNELNRLMQYISSNDIEVKNADS